MLEEFYRMEMGNKLLISLITGVVISILLYAYTARKYRSVGRSVKHLELKILLLLSPVMLLPILISEELPVIVRIVIFLISIAGGVMYYFSISASHIRIRRIFGLSPRDEHTGLVIKEEMKAKGENKQPRISRRKHEKKNNEGRNFKK